MDWLSVLTIVGSTVVIVGFFFNRLDKDIKDVRDDLKTAVSRIDATNARIDAMGARIDTTQAIIMRMLEKRGM